jgi:hypothetical protein
VHLAIQNSADIERLIEVGKTNSIYLNSENKNKGFSQIINSGNRKVSKQTPKNIIK